MHVFRKSKGMLHNNLLLGVFAVQKAPNLSGREGDVCVSYHNLQLLSSGNKKHNTQYCYNAALDESY